MLVYSTEDKFNLTYKKKIIDDKDGVEILCMAEGLYPKPTLDISIEGVPQKEMVKPTVMLREDGLYDISLRTAYLDEGLPEAAIVKCMLSIRKANYNTSRQVFYYPGMTATTTATGTTKLLHKMEIQEVDNSETDSGGGNFTDRLSINIFLIMIHLALVSMFK